MSTTALYARIHFTDDELAEEGARYPAGRLADGARTRLGYFDADQAVFAKGYFDAGWRALMLTAIADLDAQKGSRDTAGSSARPSGEKADASHHALESWVGSYQSAVKLAAPSLQAEAPRPPHNWKRATAIAGAAEGLVQFAEKHPELTTVDGAAPLAPAGRAALEALREQRKVHAVDLGQVSPQVKALHVAEGLVAMELERLSVAAHELLPARAALYAVAPIGHPHRHRAAAATSPTAPEKKVG
jgi:hypothetical protein